jgi:hypothetical protein
MILLKFWLIATVLSNVDVPRPVGKQFWNGR